MAFQKGISGNPAGRPPGRERGRLGELRLAIAKATRNGQAIIDAVVPLLTDEKPEVRLRAAEFLTDRLVGKAVQAVEMTGADGGPLLVEDVRSQLLTRAAALVESEQATAVH